MLNTIKEIVKTFFVVVFLLGCATAVLIALPNAQDYIHGDLFRYKGESEVTFEQLSILLQDHSKGYSQAITSVNVTGNKALIEYDLYEEDLAYLNKQPYSVFDIPGIQSIVSALVDVKEIIIGAFGSLIVIFLLIYFLKRKGIDAGPSIVKHLRRFAFFLQNKGRKIEKLKEMYPDCIRKAIEIDLQKVDGLIGFRSWRCVTNEGVLYSVIKPKPWTDKTFYDYRNPDEDDYTGIHSFRVGSAEIELYKGELKDVLGIVELGGEYVEHEDGIIRSQSCTILFLIMNAKLGESIERYSRYYGVPVVITDNPFMFYNQWVVSRNGIDCMEHNLKLIGDTDGIEGESNQERKSAGEVSGVIA